VRKSERVLYTIPGSLPAIGTPMPGCVFVDRCPLATDVCHTDPPGPTAIGDGRFARCHHIDRLGELGTTDGAPTVPTAQGEVVLSVNSLSKTFHQAGHSVPALVGVDLQLADGETLGLVGESGSGKSTLAKTILGIHAPDAGGVIEVAGETVPGTVSHRSQNAKRSLQMVFQNPDSALNSSWTVRRILARSVRKLTAVRGAEADARVDQLAEHLRLSQRHLDLKPRQLSGGLKQRVAIARAFAGDPKIVVCDEPTSALDVSVQAAILNLLADLQAKERTSYLFISHDLGVVRYLADRIAVMYLGRVMELGKTDLLTTGPNHPYTEALLSAVPSVDGQPSTRIRLEGEIPSPANPPTGCVFHPRCPRRLGEVCETTEPPLVEAAPGHQMRCHIPIDELRRLQAATLAAAE
jgi:peptide/nickel transport system ATP-binding protein